MPYIKKYDEHNFDIRKYLQEGNRASNAGELNYQIFYFIKHNYNVYEDDGDFIQFKIRNFVGNFLGGTPNYQKYNDMEGCLTLCYKEIKRRLGYKVQILLDIRDEYDDMINQYEDTKIISNGDVE